MQTKLTYKGLFLLFLLSPIMVKAQSNKISSAMFSGALIIGYADNGAFVNVLGSNIKLAVKNFEAQLGLLPSLKLKQDRNSPRNSFITSS